ncbi:Smr protein/MutS2 [Tepidicaulis marinus]|jgi:DNA-nicking Smr family endonuclease|uniref:Smr protein/MutS2 n=1 Tax=Tepidicaulis marinus TaxID=1333998 RepID=A0A081B6Q0_9HYPH|nr:Smr/MutS family protein [Tepidicaulis marinus]GAK43718.1 Smr protein/MutS2 [Tepidicaulis marinus]
MARKRPARPLSPEEKKLWKEVTETVTPAPGRMAPLPEMEEDGMKASGKAGTEANPSPRSAAKSTSRKGGAPAPSAKTLPPQRLAGSEIIRPPSPPPLTGLDRRTSQRLSRGQIEPQAFLDLHGETKMTAEMRLTRFLQDERARGTRVVLVITGKGNAPHSRHTLHGHEFYHAPERKAVLRQLVPDWLHGDRLRGLVAGFQPAHPRHGGGGALYVWLRRKR